MFSQREIDFMRSEVDKEFNSLIRISRGGSDDETVDPDTLQIIEDPDTTIYDNVPCWYQPTTRNYERAFDFGEAKQSSRTYIFRMSWRQTDLRVNDIIEVLDAPDPFFHGRVFKITDPMSSSEGVWRVVIAEVEQGF